MNNIAYPLHCSGSNIYDADANFIAVISIGDDNDMESSKISQHIVSTLNAAHASEQSDKGAEELAETYAKEMWPVSGVDIQSNQMIRDYIAKGFLAGRASIAGVKPDVSIYLIDTDIYGVKFQIGVQAFCLNIERPIEEAQWYVKQLETAFAKLTSSQPVSDSGWISVETRLPDDLSYVLYSYAGQVRHGQYTKSDGWIDTSMIFGRIPNPRLITHWQPLPSAPISNQPK